MKNTYYKNIRKVLGWISYYLLPAFLFGSLFLLPENELKYASVEWGEWAINLFIFIMFVKPISRFLPQINFLKKIVIWRKELGVATFYLAFFHMVGLFLSTSLWSYPEEWLWGFQNIATLFGTISLFLMFLLYITSNRKSIKILKKKWKVLHYLAYPALFFAFLHKFGTEHGEYLPAFVVFLVFCVLKFFEWKKNGKILKNNK